MASTRPVYSSQLCSTSFPNAFDMEGGLPAGALAEISAAQKSNKLLVPRSRRSKPWKSGWHPWRVITLLMYLGLLSSYMIYISFRIRYTLKIARNPGDNSSSAIYTLSFYSIFTLVVEVFCMAAMALYAVNKTYYPAKTWPIPAPQSVKGPFKVAVCVCCYKEHTHTLANTLTAVATAIRAARIEGLIASGTAVWLCDDTPVNKVKITGEHEEDERKQCEYSIEGVEFRHQGFMRVNRMQMVENMRYAFPDITFVHRLPTSDDRRAEKNGLNKKSGNLNSALREIWPSHVAVTDRDVLVVLDADQAAFSDFLVKMLPCLDAGVESDNLALVQSPQVFEGVHPVYDIFNHQNVEFWSTLMVAYNTTGFISCAGTNFAIRATALKAMGSSPFPTHTVTEDFALGMRLRAHSPPFSAIYLPSQLVKGTAPDTIRAAFKQRSRWTKGPFQMLVSAESPLWFMPSSGAERSASLSIRDRICFLSPVFNTVVNCIATPFSCFVPCFFIWTGHFPASLTLHTIIAAVVAMAFTLFFKFFARPSVGVQTVCRHQEQPLKVNGQIQRRKHSFASYILAEWNADVNIRNFWWLFAKVIINFFLRCCGCRRPAGFSPTVGGSSTMFEGFLDIFPLFLLWLMLMASVTWGALQLYVGARLLGPLGICMAWALYQAIPPAAMMFYVLFRVRHVPKKRGCCWCYEHWGRAVFSMLYLASFVLSCGCLVVAAVLACKTIPRQSAFTQNTRTFTDRTGKQITYHYFYTAKTTYELLRNNLNSGVKWEWHL